MLMKESISFAICTFNRCDQLAVTLESFIENQCALVSGDEILVIDNNSTDDTKATVIKYSNRLGIEGVNVRYVFEEEQGLSAARNRALSEFKNNFILFFDDDITILDKTIPAYRKALTQYPNTSIFGGKINVDWGAEEPRWYGNEPIPNIDGLIGRYDLGASDLDYSDSDRLPFGANFGLRGSLIRKVGNFDVALGVNGDQIGRGEETDYIQRAFELGYSGTYLAAAAVEHRFQTERINISYFYRYGVQKGLGERNQHDPIYWFGMMEQALKGGYQLLKGRRDRFYQCVINIGLYRGLWIKNRLKR